MFVYSSIIKCVTECFLVPDLPHFFVRYVFDLKFKTVQGTRSLDTCRQLRVCVGCFCSHMFELLFKCRQNSQLYICTSGLK